MHSRKIRHHPAHEVSRKHLQIVGVVWTDATFSDQESPTPLPMFTVGFLVEDEKTHVSIAHEIGLDGDFRGVTAVPRGMVRSILVLKKRLTLDLCT